MKSTTSAGNIALSLISFQLFSRIITFLFNALLIRLSNPQILGIAIIKLDFLHNTIVHLAREGFRISLLRYRPSSAYAIWQSKLTYMALMVLPTSIPIITAFLVIYYLSIPVELITQKTHYFITILIYMMGAVLELAAEPCYLLFLHQQNIHCRLVAEGVALILRAAITLLITWRLTLYGWDSYRIALFAFPIGQVCYALSLFTLLWYQYFKITPSTILPQIKHTIRHGYCLNESVYITQAQALTRQNILKFMIARGDFWIISLCAPLKDQGIYAIITNYGSLICRIIFQPLEESTLTFLCSNLAASQTQQSAFEYFALVLRVEAILCLFILSYGPLLCRPLISIVLGQQWMTNEMISCLQAYCILLPLMAFSGMMEAFLNASLLPKEMSKYRHFILFTTITFLSFAILLIRLYQSLGLIIANMINFTLRIAYSIYHLKTNFNTFTPIVLKNAIPRYSFLYFIILYTAFIHWISHCISAASQIKQLMCLMGTVPAALTIAYLLEWNSIKAIFNKKTSLKVE